MQQQHFRDVGMVLSDGSTEHGGYHEALIGLGSVLGPGMVLVVEGYFGEVGADHGVKLGDQFVVTEDGARTLVSYPWSDSLLAGG